MSLKSLAETRKKPTIIKKLNIKQTDHLSVQTKVRLLHVSSSSGSVHSIREVEVATFLTLNSSKEFTNGVNKDVIGKPSKYI